LTSTRLRGQSALCPDFDTVASGKKPSAGKPAESRGGREEYNTFRILIPSYKEDSVILDVAKKAARKQSYPRPIMKSRLLPISLQPSTLAALRQLPIEVVEVHFESSTKVKSLNFALTSLPGDMDYAVSSMRTISWRRLPGQK